MLWGLIIVFIGLACFRIADYLSQYFLRKNAPELLEHKTDLMKKGEFLELASRHGIVPRWVGITGVLSLPLVAIGVLVLIVRCIYNLMN